MSDTFASQACWAIIPAAGSGSRLAGLTSLPKQFLCLEGRPLWWHSAQAIAKHSQIKGIVLVLPDSYLEQTANYLKNLEQTDLGVPVRLCAGGQRRQDSVRLALAQVPANCPLILVHDAARPFVGTGLVERLLQPFRLADCTAHGIIPGLAPVDTIKQVNASDQIVATLDRQQMRLVQTPQVFRAAELRQAHQLALDQDWEVTDDAALLEKAGYRILVLPGEAGNCKITLAEDLRMLQPGPAPAPRVGFGYDVHRFGGNRPLRLGGVDIPSQDLVLAHSDGDVLLHALADAILGCIGAGDLGQHFPDTDPIWDNADSALLLDRVLELALRKGLVLDNADLTVAAQKPKLAPFARQIKRNLARLLALPEDQVNFKATTEEGLGFTGRQEGIKAMAVVCGHLLCKGEPWTDSI